jgi:hypothetical protein
MSTGGGAADVPAAGGDAPPGEGGAPPAAVGGGDGNPAQPAQAAANQLIQQLVQAAAVQVQAAQQQAQQNPPAGLVNFPLAPGDPFGDSLLTCGINTNHGQYAICTTEGINTMERMAALDSERIETMAVALGRRTQPQGGYRLSALQISNLQAFAWWLQDLQDRAQPIGPAFTNANLAAASSEMAAYKRMVKHQQDMPLPDKYTNDSKWVGWWESVRNYFTSTLGVCRQSLAYVICPEAIPDNPTPEETILHQITLTGPNYRLDNAKVYNTLKHLTIDTSAYNWIKQYDSAQDGRAAALALMAQHEGTAQKRSRYLIAKAQLEKIFYKDKQAFSFTKYASNLQGIFTTMAEYRPKEPEEQVEDLIEKMQTNHDSVFTNIKMAAQRNHPDDFI